MSNKTDERRNQIVDIVIKNGSITSGELKKHFNVSGETIRKDLTYLDDIGFVKKTNGGAVFSTQYLTELQQERTNIRSDEKKLISEAALRLIPNENIVIYIDGGSTCGIFASLLNSHMGLTVVSPSLLVVNSMQNQPQHALYITGGYAHWNSMILSGPVLDQAMSDFRFSIAVLGTSGIRYHDGATVRDHSEVSYKKKVVNSSDIKILLCDHSKFAVGGLAQYATWDSIDYFITDKGSSDADLEKVRKCKEIIVV